MANIFRNYLRFFYIGFLVIRRSSADCKYNVKDLPETHQTPIFLKPGNPFTFQQPDSQGIVTLKVNDKITIACPGNKNIITPDEQERQTISTFCDSQGIICTVTDIKLLQCSLEVVARVLQLSNPCGNNGNVTIVGYDVPASQTQKSNFVKSYSLCFEDQKYIPSYSSHQLGVFVHGIKPVHRPYFRSGGVVPDLTNDYKSASAYLINYLGTSNYTEHNQLTKGHLVPKGDFYYAPQEDATFFFENSAPQWATINDGNWAIVEKGVRFLSRNRFRLDVVTGTFGVIKLQDQHHISKEIYLNGNRRVPIPAVFWKVIIDPISHEGVALFGSNNPFASLVSQNIVPCDTTVCELLRRWLHIKALNVAVGEIVCCEVKRVKLNISGLPPASLVTKLLT